MNVINNKILLEYNQYTPCKAIFQAVCDEIGALHYLFDPQKVKNQV
jgi:hypothetical protein